MLTLLQLLKPATQDEAFELLLTLARSLGFPVTSWQPGGVARTLLRAFARPYADATSLIAGIAGGGFLDTARGAWLTLLARAVFGVERKVATFTTGKVLLEALADAGPYTVEPGDLWFTTASGKRFVSTSGGTLNPGESLLLDVRSESPGSSYAVGVGTITTMVTPLAGVSCTNPDLGAGAGWMLKAGTDEEEDEPLRARCRMRWSTLGGQPPGEAYAYWALLDPRVARVLVDDQNPAGAGSVRVYLADSAKGVLPVVVNDVATFLAPRKAKTAALAVRSVDVVNITVGGNVHVRAAQMAAVQTAVLDALDRFFRELPIGGEIVPPESQGKVFRAKLLGLIGGIDGVVTVTGFTPAADVKLERFEVATWANALTFVAV